VTDTPTVAKGRNARTRGPSGRSGKALTPRLAVRTTHGGRSCSAEEIADAIRSFRDAGFTQLEMMLHPGTVEAVDATAPVLARLDAS
jgi:hypothetical protein